MDFEVGLSVSLGLLNFKNTTLFFKHFQNGPRGSNMGLKPFLSIHIKVDEPFQTTDNQVIPLDIHNVPSLFLGVSG